MRPHQSPASISVARHILPIGQLAFLLAALGGCTRTQVPDPNGALEAYQQAAERGDSEALHAMLSERAKANWSKDDVDRTVRRDSKELAAHAREFGKAAKIEARATLELEDGSLVDLELHNGKYGIASASHLPGGSPTPEGALQRLAHALTHHRLDAIFRALAPSTRRIFEGALLSLSRGLQAPRALDVQRNGEAATVAVPGGHVVNLRQTDGLWYVETFR
jgi:hypothetical protein